MARDIEAGEWRGSNPSKSLLGHSWVTKNEYVKMSSAYLPVYTRNIYYFDLIMTEERLLRTQGRE